MKITAKDYEMLASLKEQHGDKEFYSNEPIYHLCLKGLLSIRSDALGDSVYKIIE